MEQNSIKKCVEWNGIGSNLYHGNEIISKLGYQTWQDLIACGRLETTTIIVDGGKIYKYKQ